jgi:hypothetical protein
MMKNRSDKIVAYLVRSGLTQSQAVVDGIVFISILNSATCIDLDCSDILTNEMRRCKMRLIFENYQIVSAVVSECDSKIFEEVSGVEKGLHYRFPPPPLC